jgi:hypothetical protein
VWLGDPAAADESLISDIRYNVIRSEPWRRLYRRQGDQLLADNALVFDQLHRTRQKAQQPLLLGYDPLLCTG